VAPPAKAPQPGSLASMQQKLSGSGPKLVAAKTSPWGSGAAGRLTNPLLASKQAEMEQRQAELQARRAKSEELKRAHTSAFAVRKIIQRLRVCDPAQFPELVAELEQAQMENLENMGDLADVVREESERALELAEKRFKEFEEKQLAKERADAERKAKAAEIAERMGAIAEEATQDVEEVEAKIARVVEESQVLSEETGEVTAESLLEAVKTTEESIAAAKDAHKAAVASLKAHRDDVSKARAGKESSQITSQLIELQKRLAEKVKELTPLVEVMKSATSKASSLKERDARRAAAEKKEQAKKEAFSKFDTDGDGKLNRREVVAFAESEYSYQLDGATVDKILGKIPGGRDGVVPEKLQQLRSLVSQEKSIARARRERQEAEEKARLKKEENERLKREREEKQAALTEKMRGVDEEISKADELLAKTRKAAKTFAANGKEELTASLLEEAAGATESEASAGIAALDAGEEILRSIGGEDEQDKVSKNYRDAELKRREDRMKGLRAQFIKANTQAKEARDGIARKRYAEMERLRSGLVPCILSVMRADGKTGPEFFKAIAKSKDSLGAQDFNTFIKSLSDRGEESLRTKPIEDAQVETLFAHIASGCETISEERFLASTELYYKVVKNTVITADKGITSKVARKLEIGEVVQLLEGPAQEGEGENGLQRLRCKAAQDCQEGWVTVSGNKGTVFLDPISSYYTCLKETNLAEGPKVGDKTVRKIAKGETAQTLEPERKDESNNVKRMKVRLVKDDVTGWVTTTGNKEEQKFFVAC